MTVKRPPLSHKHRSLPAQAFLLAFLAAALIFVPFIIHDRGYFIYQGDFNVQQIPFYMLAHDAVRSGDIFWNWYTDLGANFIGSYSFYLLFSPFFWLTLPFPNSFLPHLMAPLLILKTASASLTAFLYLRRFVKDQRYAIIGGLLYAFSGWMDFNVFFNHFHEVAVFFPLLLLSLEKLVTEKQKGFFALMVVVNAIVNYWFFIGEVVFVVLYVIVRGCYNKSWGLTLKKFFLIVWESALGVLIAAMVLIPSVLAIMDNTRVGTDSLLNGWNFWLYWDSQRLPAILQSFFFPPEQPAWSNFFPDNGAYWASLSAWLPLLGPVGVMAYLSRRKKDWLKTLIGLCIFIALVPGLNSLFVLLNSSYYARWFYMPILMISLASIRAVEDMSPDAGEFGTAMRWQLLIVSIFTAAVCLTPNKVDDKWRIGLAQVTWQAWIAFGIVVVCVLLTWLLVVRCRRNPNFLRIFGAGVALVAVCFTTSYLFGVKEDYWASRFVAERVIGGKYEISLPEEPFARSDSAKAFDNLLMFWKLPNIQAFHSIVPASIMEFYPAVGVERNIDSRPGTEFYALRPLLSVRWLFFEEKNFEELPMPGYSFYDVQNGFQVYENDCYLPMGFTYEHAISREDLEAVTDVERGNLLLRAILLDGDAMERHSDILSILPELEKQNFDVDSYYRDVENRREYTADGFYRDRLGFGAKTDFLEDKLVFFSVPWEKGWSASVNGESALIEKANVGFMAVRVPAGPAEIRFDYRTPGLMEGLMVSGTGAAILLLYLLTARRIGARQCGKETVPRISEYEEQDHSLSWDEYLAAYDPAERIEKLRSAFQQEEIHHVDRVLPQEQSALTSTLPDQELPTDISAQTVNNDTDD